MSDSYLGRVLSTAIATVLAATGVLSSPSARPTAAPPARAAHSPGVPGRDVSWPNCPKGLGMPSRPTQGKPMPPPTAPFVVIGLTNGPAFHPNPCLTAQVDYAKQNHLWASAYAVATYPTPWQLDTYGATGPHTHGHRVGRLWNTGWAQARTNVAAMDAVGLHSPALWIDVEPVSAPSPWSHRRGGNRAVLDGAIAYYRSAGLRVGFYSTQNMWRDIVGPVGYGFAEWRTAGLSTRRAAVARCRTGRFQGGRAVLTQWYSPREDFDLVCPGPPARHVLRRYFTRF